MDIQPLIDIQLDRGTATNQIAVWNDTTKRYVPTLNPTGPADGIFGHWSRDSGTTTITSAVAGDDLTLTGNLTLPDGGTISALGGLGTDIITLDGTLGEVTVDGDLTVDGGVFQSLKTDSTNALSVSPVNGLVTVSSNGGADIAHFRFYAKTGNVSNAARLEFLEGVTAAGVYFRYDGDVDQLAIGGIDFGGTERDGIIINRDTGRIQLPLIMVGGDVGFGNGGTDGVNTTFTLRGISNDTNSARMFLMEGSAVNGGSLRYDGNLNDFFIGTVNSSGESAAIKLDRGSPDVFLLGKANVAGTSNLVGNVRIGDTTAPTEALEVVGNLVLPKTSGNGIKVDTTTPTFGFADLLGDQFSRNTGATKPTLVVYNGAVLAWQFGAGDEAYLSYHIPHDYVPGTDIFLHIHWSQNAAGATGGTLDFKYFAIYAKGHNQASGSTFTATPITATFSSIDINDGGGGLNQYQHHLTEVVISAATATAALFDRDDFEPDGVIELTFEMDADNLTGTASTPFVHYVDIHYQTTGLIGTKDKVPDFYT